MEGQAQHGQVFWVHEFFSRFHEDIDAATDPDPRDTIALRDFTDTLLGASFIWDFNAGRLK